MFYVDVILPLPLPGTFTYSVPPAMENDIQPGSRVYVPFGRKKYYTGVVERLHDEAPTHYEVKPVAMLLDATPVVRYPQFKFWHWIADYYLCTPGEVYRCAVPTGLRIESETTVSLNTTYEPEAQIMLNARQIMVVEELERSQKTSIAALAEKCGIPNISPVVNSLLSMGIVEIDERMIDKYRPVRRTLVRLLADRGDEEVMHRCFDKVRRSPVQERILLAYIDKSGWMHPRNPLQEVERSELLAAANATATSLKGLIDKGVMEVYKKTVNRFNKETTESETVPAAELSPEQADAKRQIIDSFRRQRVTLLHGVTGSGKTEIYIHLMQQALAQGNQVLYLVPEISLTTQLTDKLRRVFGSSLLVYHSKFSDSERVDIYRRLLDTSEPMVVLGARSAVFLPFAHLGFVVVDEEHESSYKQYDPAPRYNARDAAIVLASMHGAPVLLGSATPSIETYYKAQSGKYGLVTLASRYSDVALPQVRIVDMKQQRRRKLVRHSFSQPLLQEVTAALGSRRQAILFQNRRGFAPMVVCKECGWTPKCKNCDVSMVYHKNINQLRCHYCGYAVTLPSVCPACGLNGVQTYGYGTERIAEDTAVCFPDARVSRMDLDTTRNKNAYQDIIETFAEHKTDILVGTQMVSKGLDFEKVDVVGVVNADTLLNFPDFRSDERAFNMLEQVSGRAGRRSGEGCVVIQTTDPDNAVLAHVRDHDYAAHYSSSLEDRRRFNYPPFSRIVNIYLKHRDREAVDSLAVDYVLFLRGIFGDRVLGPERPAVGRVANRYIQSVMIKIEAGASMPKVKSILRGVYEHFATDQRMKQAVLYYDVDPV